MRNIKAFIDDGSNNIQVKEDNGNEYILTNKEKSDGTKEEVKVIELRKWSDLTPKEQEQKKELFIKHKENPDNKALKKKTIQETTKLLLAKELDTETVKKCIGSDIPIEFLDENTMSVFSVMTLSMISQAIKGNTKAYEILRDTTGWNPKAQEETVDLMTDSDRRLMENISNRLGK